MASVSSRQKNVTRSNPTAEFSRLLQSNAGIEPVTPELVFAAERLSELGLISYKQTAYVKCSFSEDKDFRYSPRTCSGRCSIRENLDEDEGQYRCPDCDRILRPFGDKKQQFPEIRVKVLPTGVAKYVCKLLSDAEITMEPIADVEYAWRIDNGLAGIHICLADFCDHDQLMSIQWAQQHPTCYLAVNPHASERFIDIPWVSRVMLADLVADQTDLVKVIQDLMSNVESKDIPPLATPVYSKGAHQPQVPDVGSQPAPGVFFLEYGKKTLRINGLDILDTRAATSHLIMRELVRAFLKDVSKRTLSADYCCQTPSDLADSIQESQGKSDAMDADQIRRTINRLQESFEERLRKEGHAADRDCIIQTSPNSTKEGYRLNPFKVAIRPLQDK